MPDRTIFVIGAPGSGKSTLTEALARRLGYASFYSGEAFRQAAQSYPDTRTRERIVRRMAVNRPMPISVYCEVIAHSVHRGEPGLVVDGFPRSRVQCLAIPRILAALHRAATSVVGIALHAPEPTLVTRVLGRAARRDDDDETTLRRRLRLHHSEQATIEAEFGKRWQLHHINSAQPFAEVVGETIEAIESAPVRTS
ncbi:adenylate kinase family enzyme [Crossiella equi]|uniref:Adenylate kinase n=1 Tax=Crossiella equi TaxID=130796 RepID=A0ABS5A7N0_9PSEU|nr:nucleoside monophosphate kinase [Crossiella equi]MBP2472311.1 adenylate kinase family enzyme [Crossiella equi]